MTQEYNLALKKKKRLCSQILNEMGPENEARSISTLSVYVLTIALM